MGEGTTWRQGQGASREHGPGVPVPGADERLERLFGRAALDALAASTVLVMGLGGVGSSCAEALARGGVGGFVLLDGDAVEPSNLNRQAIAFAQTVGRRKVEVSRDMVRAINPAARVRCVDAHVLEADLPALFDGAAAGVDFVVDALDTITVKLAAAKLAEERGIRIVSSMGAAMRVRPDALRFADLYQTQTDPLCRVMRKEARRRGIERLKVLYSTEPPRPPLDGGGAQAGWPHRREPLGTASFLPPIMGQMIAGHVICELAGVDGGAGR